MLNLTENSASEVKLNHVFYTLTVLFNPPPPQKTTMKWNKSFFLFLQSQGKLSNLKSQWFWGEILFSSCFLASMGGISLKSTPNTCFHSPIFLTLACLFVTLSLSHSHAPGWWLGVTKIFSLNCHHTLRRRRRRMGIITKKKKSHLFAGVNIRPFIYRFVFNPVCISRESLVDCVSHRCCCLYKTDLLHSLLHHEGGVSRWLVGGGDPLRPRLGQASRTGNIYAVMCQDQVAKAAILLLIW